MVPVIADGSTMARSDLPGLPAGVLLAVTVESVAVNARTVGMVATAVLVTVTGWMFAKKTLTIRAVMPSETHAGSPPIVASSPPSVASSYGPVMVQLRILADSGRAVGDPMSLVVTDTARDA